VKVSDDEISYSIVIHNCSKKGDALGAAGWLEAMVASAFTKPNVFAFNAVIAGFARKGSAAEAVGWLSRMRSQGLEPNVVSYTAVIDGCAKAGDPTGAEYWFEAMLEEGVAPSRTTYNALINCYARIGDTEGALAWLERLRASSEPDEISYNSAIHSCANARPPDDAEAPALAEKLFREMLEDGLWPTASTLSALGLAMGARRRDELCASLGIDLKRAMQHRRPHKHRRVAPLS
jgi:pentatricopeptide repeat protein